MEDSIKHVESIDLITQAYENIDLDTCIETWYQACGHVILTST